MWSQMSTRGRKCSLQCTFYKGGDIDFGVYAKILGKLGTRSGTSGNTVVVC